MRRRAGIALVAAALIGTTGGVGLAINGADRQTATPENPGDTVTATPGATPTASMSATPTASSTTKNKTESSKKPSSTSTGEAFFGVGEAKANTPLLYVAGKTIHDGDKSIAINGLGDLYASSIDRLDKGYLVRSNAAGDGRDTGLHLVDASGKSRLLMSHYGTYDINLAKDRIVAVDFDSAHVVVFSSDGKEIARSEESVAKPLEATVGFVEDEILIVSGERAKKQKATRWNPTTDKTTKVSSPGVLDAGVSPGGSFLAGNTNVARNDDSCLKVVSDKRVGVQHKWTACGWRTVYGQAQFSPDGSQVLAVPAQTDGFGPGSFAIFGVREDSADPVSQFDTPDLTLAATWADDEHLWLSGARGGQTDFSKGWWIKKCDLKGACETVTKTQDSTRIVLGGDVY